jgi:hypothetical protein
VAHRALTHELITLAQRERERVHGADVDAEMEYAAIQRIVVE